MQQKLFQRRVENFVCDHCGCYVRGNGYTNHCPHCLWSKHVDDKPGDRIYPCGGLMQPVRVEGSSPRYKLVHCCEKCGVERKNSVNSTDNLEILAAVARER